MHHSYITDGFEFNHRITNHSLSYDFHLNSTLEIYFLIEGEVQYFIEKQIYTVSPGSLLIINDKELHTRILKSKGTYNRILIVFDPSLVTSYNSEEFNIIDCFVNRVNGQKNKITPNQEQLEEITNIFQKIETHTRHPENGGNILINLYFIELLVYINRLYLKADYHQEPINTNETMMEVLNYIDINLSKDLSLENLEKVFNINKYHLGRQFKSYTSTTIHQYIIFKRVSKAKFLLSSGYSVTDSCYMCGFNDYSNFIRMFSKIVGKTPSKYIKEYNQINHIPNSTYPLVKPR